MKSLFHKKSSLIVWLLVLIFAAAPPAYNAIRLHTTLPDNLVLTQGGDCKIEIGNLVTSDTLRPGSAKAINTNNEALAQAQGPQLTLNTKNAGSYDVRLNLLGVLPVKTIQVNVVEKNRVIPCGNTVGIKINTKGVLVVGISFVEDENQVKHSPAKDAGLKAGDVILKVDETPVKNAQHFGSLIQAKKGEPVTVEYVRDQQVSKTQLSAIFSDGSYKIGAWVRDSTAGIGTVTFIKPDTNVFAALGHGISDTDTGQLLKVANGGITHCQITSVIFADKGAPGELKGVFSDNDIGSILENSPVGLYGKGKLENFPNHEPVEIATRFETRTGSAQMLCSIDSDKVEAYDIEIEKVMTSSSDGKGMIIKVVDPRLLAKTGGIVQGMSGSPIMQGGKLVGAVTHVFVNDPTRGYGIFVELMMDKAYQYG